MKIPLWQWVIGPTRQPLFNLLAIRLTERPTTTTISSAPERALAPDLALLPFANLVANIPLIKRYGGADNGTRTTINIGTAEHTAVMAGIRNDAPRSERAEPNTIPAAQRRPQTPAPSWHRATQGAVNWNRAINRHTRALPNKNTLRPAWVLCSQSQKTRRLSGR